MYIWEREAQEGGGYIYTYMCTYIQIYNYIYMGRGGSRGRVCVCMHIYMYERGVSVCVCVCVCVCVYIYGCMIDGRGHHNNVKQLSSNKKRKKIQSNAFNFQLAVLMPFRRWWLMPKTCSLSVRGKDPHEKGLKKLLASSREECSH